MHQAVIRADIRADIRGASVLLSMEHLIRVVWVTHNKDLDAKTIGFMCVQTDMP